MSGFLKTAVASLMLLLILCVFHLVVGPEIKASEVETDNPALVENLSHLPTNKKFTGKKITIDVNNMEIHKLIQMISEVADKDILVPDFLNDKITLKLEDVPWDQALDIVLSPRNLEFEESGGVLTIYDSATLKNIKAGREKIQSERRSTIPSGGPLAKKVFTPKYAPVSLMLDELRKHKSERGKIVGIENDIYVEDWPEAIAAMSEAALRIDEPAAQILIEAYIVQCSSAFAEKYGLKREGSYAIGHENEASERGLPGTTEVLSVTPGSIESMKLNTSVFKKTDALSLPDAISGAERSNEVRILSRPRIRVVNDQEVSIKQGGYRCLNDSGLSTPRAAHVVHNVDFKEIVMELKARPHFEENSEFVSFDLGLEFDASQCGTEPAAARASAGLTIKDGDTFVINGLYTEDNSDAEIGTVSGHVVPLAAWLAGVNSQSKETETSEIIVFITANFIPIKN